MVSQENGEPGMCSESTVFAREGKYQAVRLQGFVTRSRVRFSAGRTQLGSILFLLPPCEDMRKRRRKKDFQNGCSHALPCSCYFLLF